MAWYSTGTVAVTLNSTTVTGTGTSFAANARVGDAFKGPDGAWYEITNIASATVLSILPSYKGATATGQAYSITPVQGYVKDSADRLRAISDSIQAQGNNARLASIGSVTLATNDVIMATGGTTVSGLPTGVVGRAVLAAESAATGKTALGIGNVDNTSDVNKPVSTATTAAINASSRKFSARGAIATATITLPSSAVGNLYNVSASNPTITLPVASECQMGAIALRIIGAGTATLATQGSDVIQAGSSTSATLSMASGTYVEIMASGATWFVSNRGVLGESASLSSPTFTGTLTADALRVSRTANSAAILLSANSGNIKAIQFQTNDSTRWQVDSNSTPETGSNAGSDFRITRFSDAGAGVQSALSIERSTGITTIAALTVTGSTAVTGPVRVGQYTLTTLPSASTFSGYEIDVTNATGGSKRCRSDGTAWKILNTTTTVS